ncbi:SDR family oxidoreductase [bacterium]|jgi:3-oxoacyl-[acyl-carrier protein] reductase|nr:SDR family oxidoreductase [bacterium]MDB9845261.1 SDR family oxidoreductase [Acidimicrobiales bacterium]
MRFDDKRVIVTGAGGGFGAAIARGFAAKGAKVMVTDIDVTAAQAVADELDGALAFGLDVTSEDAHKELADVVVEAWGGIDIVACNAGLPHRGGYMVNLTTEQFDFMWTINVRPIFFASKYFVPHMAAGGAIVSTASIGGRRPRKGLTPYNASKAAVITLTKGLAVELAPDIRVNCVAPVSSPTGFDMSAMGIEKLSENREKMVVDGIPMGRRATPEDVANSVMFLASEEAGFLTGVCLDVDGGRSIG